MGKDLGNINVTVSNSCKTLKEYLLQNIRSLRDEDFERQNFETNSSSPVSSGLILIMFHSLYFLI